MLQGGCHLLYVHPNFLFFDMRVFLNCSPDYLFEVSPFGPFDSNIKIVLVNEGIEVFDDVRMVQTPRITKNLLKVTALPLNTFRVVEAPSCQKFSLILMLLQVYPILSRLWKPRWTFQLLKIIPNYQLAWLFYILWQLCQQTAQEQSHETFTI